MNLLRFVSRHIAAFRSFGLCVLLSFTVCSCIFFEVSTGLKIDQPADPKLIGTWVCPQESREGGGSAIYEIRRQGAGHILTILMDDKVEFSAYRIDEKEPGMLEMELERGRNDDGKWEPAAKPIYCVVATRFEGDALVMKRLKSPDKPDINKDEELRKHLAEALKSLDWATAPPDDDKTSHWETRRLLRMPPDELKKKLEKDIAKSIEAMKEVDAKLAENRDKQAALAARQSSIGGEPWPPPDLPFASAADWHRQMIDATMIAKPDFVKAVKKVRLEISRNPKVAKLVTDEEFWLLAAKSAHAAGFEVDPGAPVKLSVSLSWRSVEKTTREGNMVVGQTTFSQLLFELKLLVPARILRGGDFYHAEVAPAASLVFMGKVGDYDGAAIKDAFPRMFAEGLRQMTKAGFTWEGKEVWASQVGSLDKAEKRFQSYRAARRDKRDEVRRSFTGLTDFSGVIINLEGRASELVAKDYLEKEWTAALRGAGLNGPTLGAPALTCKLIAQYHGPKSVAGALFTPDNDRWTFVEWVTFSEMQAVYDFNGRLCRGLVELSAESYAGFALKHDVHDQLKAQIAETVADFVEINRNRR